MNVQAFLADQWRYFEGAYDQFQLFGGPCVYFHLECLRAGRVEFLSDRHLEMLYATLTAWGMHRLGDTDRSKTKLETWEVFRDSLRTQSPILEPLRSANLLEISEAEYAVTLDALKPCYTGLRLAKSRASLVVNSKALFHALPRLIPPIDRHYTIRFFKQTPENWRRANGSFKTMNLGDTEIEKQYQLFRSTCLKIKRMVDQVDRRLLERELHVNAVTAPKALDNAIVNFVRLKSLGAHPVE